MTLRVDDTFAFTVDPQNQDVLHGFIFICIWIDVCVYVWSHSFPFSSGFDLTLFFFFFFVHWLVFFGEGILEIRERHLDHWLVENNNNKRKKEIIKKNKWEGEKKLCDAGIISHLFFHSYRYLFVCILYIYMCYLYVCYGFIYLFVLSRLEIND